MTPVVFVILAVVWAAVLIPPMVQNRAQARPGDSISAFQSQLSTLQRRTVGDAGLGPRTPANGVRAVRPLSAGPGQPEPFGPLDPAEARPVPYGRVDQARLARIDAQRRRRQVLAGLLIAAGVSLVLSIVLPPLRVLHLLIDVLLVAYVVLLVRRRKLALERAAKVRSMAQAQARRQGQVRPAAARPAQRPATRRPAAAREAAPAGRHARPARPAAGRQLDLRPAATG